MHEWRVIGLNYLLHDQQTLRSNIVESIDWSVSKEYVFSEEEHGTFRVERHGTVELLPPSNTFIALEDITESQAIEWAKSALGPAGLASLESEIDAELNLLITPTHGSGRPWTESGI